MTTVSQPGLYNVFVNELASPSQRWYELAGKVIPTGNREVIKAACLGASKGLTPWAPNTLPTQVDLAKYKLDMSIDSYNAGFPIPRGSYEANPELWDGAAAQCARDVKKSIAKLCSQHIVANRVGLDGVALFSSSHIIGGQAAQSNSWSASDIAAANVSDPTKPTVSEAIDITLQVISAFQSFVNENGDQMNDEVTSLTVLCNTEAQHYAFSEAGKALILPSGATNTLAQRVNSGELTLNVKLDKNATGANKVRFFIGGGSALIVSVDEPEDCSIYGGDYTKLMNGNSFSLLVKLGVATGWWGHAAELTLS